MSRVPPELARGIDRLARGAHAFHRFAHHPLCGEYASEVIPFGRRARVCRGCSLAAAGALAGVAGGLLAPAAVTPVALALTIVLALGLVLATTRVLTTARVLATARILSSAPVLSRIGRRSKVLSRFLPAALLAFALVGGFRDASVAGAAVALAGVASIAALLAAYRRRGPDRSPCSRCPERLLETPCRGVVPIVRRERAFQRRAGSVLARAGI